MNAEREQRARQIFEGWLEQDVADRGTWLADACGGDSELRQRVEALLEAHEKAGAFLHESSNLPTAADATITIEATEKAGDQVGRYKLLQPIGEGGCGVVYMAEQQEPIRRRVAFKVIKLGMDTKQVIARFEAERQALALMDHPNIARVLDAGTTETGRPYFVMELVRGQRITEYCDENNLSTEQRLGLFMQVCHAIQHAHQKGIIHRDVKPSNVLVTVVDGEPVPKVIDFGIAKAIGQQLTEKTLFTSFEQFIGTPAYMSPEQAQLSGVDVDTRSDIYSLGVLLYELLTGHTPFDPKTLLSAGLDEMRRVIREEEPARPSTRLSKLDASEQTTVAKRRQSEPPRLIHQVRGDLDWIVMKCLEKNRARRYESANAVAADLERHLKQEPVTAAAPGTAYRARKFIRRHKVELAVVATLVLLLAAGTVVSTWQALRARRAEQVQNLHRQQAEAEKRKAQNEAGKSRQVAQFLEDMLKGIGPSVALGRDTTVLREILDKTAERVGRDLTNQPEVEAELRATLGQVYHALGQFAQAEAMHRQALALRRQIFGNEHLTVAVSLNNLASTLGEREKRAEAEALVREALAIQRKLLGSENVTVAFSLHHLGINLTGQGKLAEAEPVLRDALALRRKLLGNEHLDVAYSLGSYANVLYESGRRAEAEPFYIEQLALLRRLVGSNHPELDVPLDNLAARLIEQGKLGQAETVAREALQMQRKMLGPEHPHIYRSLWILNDTLRRQNKLAEAEANARELVAFESKLFGEDNWGSDRAYENLASILQDLGKGAALEGSLREELAAARKTYGNAHPRVAVLLRRLSAVLEPMGKCQEAEALLRECLDLQKALPPDEATGRTNRTYSPADQRRLASLLGRQGQWKKAAIEFDKLIELDPGNHYDQMQFGALLVEVGDLPGYQAHCRKMLARFSQDKSVGVLERTAKTCLLAPVPAAELGQAVELAQEALVLGKDDPFLGFYQFVVGLAEYRQGHFDSAVEWMRKVIGQPWRTGEAAPSWERDLAAWAVLAMAQSRLQSPDEGRKALGEAIEIAQTKLPQLQKSDLGAYWHDWLIGHILLREARELIEKP